MSVEMVENLTQEGGDRFAAAAPMIAAIAAALAEAPEDEIREAFGMGAWRAVTPERRARYGEYFAPKVYWAMIRGMQQGVDSGKLDIKGFAAFDKGEPGGELFPVTDYGPCVEANMFEVDVTLSPGDDEFGGEMPSGVREGSRIEWTQGAINERDVWASEYAVIDDGAGLFAVRGGHELRLDYGGFVEEKITVVAGLAVIGHQVQNGSRWDLVIEDGAPEIAGRVVRGSVSSWAAAFPVWNPLDVVHVKRDVAYLNRVYSAWAVNAWAGRLAEGVLAPAAVHSLDFGDKPLAAPAWVNCFPRKKMIARVDIDSGAGVESRYRVVRWIDRAQWMAWYGAGFDDWLEMGCVVPGELVGDRGPGRKIYAKFKPAFIAALNEAPE